VAKRSLLKIKALPMQGFFMNTIQLQRSGPINLLLAGQLCA
jgi:hypothetical protein